MCPAGVVADHATDGAVLVSCRIGSKRQTILLCRAAELVVDNAGFYPGVTLFRVQLEQFVQILREVEHDSDVAGLSREARSSTASKDGNPVFAAYRDCLDDIFYRAWNNGADGDLAIVREIGGVDCARAGVEAYFSISSPAELFGDFGRE